MYGGTQGEGQLWSPPLTCAYARLAPDGLGMPVRSGYALWWGVEPVYSGRVPPAPFNKLRTVVLLIPSSSTVNLDIRFRLKGPGFCFFCQAILLDTCEYSGSRFSTIYQRHSNNNITRISTTTTTIITTTTTPKCPSSVPSPLSLKPLSPLRPHRRLHLTTRLPHLTNHLRSKESVDARKATLVRQRTRDPRSKHEWIHS